MLSYFHRSEPELNFPIKRGGRREDVCVHISVCMCLHTHKLVMCLCLCVSYGFLSAVDCVHVCVYIYVE